LLFSMEIFKKYLINSTCKPTCEKIVYYFYRGFEGECDTLCEAQRTGFTSIGGRLLPNPPYQHVPDVWSPISG
jgi:hypothetical protein